MFGRNACALRLIVALAIVGFDSGPSRANAFDDARAALIAQGQGDLDAAIRLYTQAIAAGELEARYLAIAFYNRGNAHFVRREYATAVTDYDAAVALRPDYALAHNNRGNAFAALGAYDESFAAFDAAIRARPDYALAFKNRGNAHAAAGFLERAIADYDAAIDSDPDLAAAYNNRANAKYLLGRFVAAAGDYEAALEIDPFDTYSMLWLYLARRHAGEDGRRALADRLAGADPDRWPVVVARHYLDAASAADVLAEIDHSDPDAARERECEADFYLGAGRQLAGDREAAQRLFRDALATGVTRFVEYMGAKAALERMAAAP